MNKVRQIANNLNRELESLLPQEMLSFLHEAAALAAERGWNIYLVGGYVRDLLLKRAHYDLDVSVEGDAIALAVALQEQRGARLEATHRFGTAYLEFGQSRHFMDLVTARRERYPAPGALPEVEAGNIYDDLARRDFTVNAMAIPLQSPGTRLLLDPHGGLDDLEAGLIRVLHPNSFLDDPTRIPRAVKYALRLGFQIEQGTLELLARAIRDGALSTVSLDRLIRELLLIMEERKAGAMLSRLEDLGILRAIHPELIWPYGLESRNGPAENADLTPRQRHETYLAVLGAGFANHPHKAEKLARSLGLGAHAGRLMRDAARLAQVWPELGQDELAPSKVHNFLKELDVAALQAYARIEAMSAHTAAWQRLQDYLHNLRHVKPSLDGHYLRGLGIPPGSVYNLVLGELLEAKLDGKLPEKSDEEKYLRQLLKREGLLSGD